MHVCLCVPLFHSHADLWPSTSGFPGRRKSGWTNCIRDRYACTCKFIHTEWTCMRSVYRKVVGTWPSLTICVVFFFCYCIWDPWGWLAWCLDVVLQIEYVAEALDKINVFLFGLANQWFQPFNTQLLPFFHKKKSNISTWQKAKFTIFHSFFRARILWERLNRC